MSTTEWILCLVKNKNIISKKSSNKDNYEKIQKTKKGKTKINP